LIHFFDTSAFVKRYLVESGSDVVRAALRKPHVGVARIIEAEVPAALARAHRERLLTVAQRDALLERFAEDLRDLTIVEIRATTLAAVSELVKRHPLRAYDAVQLACAMSLKRNRLTVTFWAADGPLCDAAEGEGLRVTRVR
jgi:predicted nucleic acid-binding protein